MANSVEDLVNQALRMCSSSRRIGNIYEGSEAAKTALELYAQTRDEMLCQAYPPFSRRTNVALTLLKGPPPPGGYNPSQPWSTAYAPPGYLYEYLYPPDCIEFKSLRSPPGLYPGRDPRPELWVVADDSGTGAGLGTLGGAVGGLGGASGALGTGAVKVILANAPNALGTYCAGINDVTLWDSLFTQTVVLALADKFNRALNRDLQGSQAAQARTQASLAVDTQQHPG